MRLLCLQYQRHACSSLLFNLVDDDDVDDMGTLKTSTRKISIQINTLSDLEFEIKKLVFILFISFCLMIIPGINIIAPLVTAFLLGWDFFDYPLARRGLTFKERKSLAFKSMWRILGLGLWLLIPFVQILLFCLHQNCDIEDIFSV